MCIGKVKGKTRAMTVLQIGFVELVRETGRVEVYPATGIEASALEPGKESPVIEAHENEDPMVQQGVIQ